jgi:hypothetical protein
VQCAAAGFVVGRYATKLDVLKLGWLPIKERRDFHLAQATFMPCTLISGLHT